MSHSTHVGFNGPVVPEAATASSRSFDRAGSKYLLACGPLAVPSLAVGVGHRPSSTARTTSLSGLAFVPNRFDAADFQSLADGVGQRRATLTWRLSNPGFRASSQSVALACLASCALGVGHDEDPPAEMGRTHCCRWNACPFCVVPEIGQVAKDVSHSGSKEPWDVFHEDVAGS